jgi:hypothetical protein
MPMGACSRPIVVSSDASTGNAVKDMEAPARTFTVCNDTFKTGITAHSMRHRITVSNDASTGKVVKDMEAPASASKCVITYVRVEFKPTACSTK